MKVYILTHHGDLMPDNNVAFKSEEAALAYKDKMGYKSIWCGPVEFELID